MTERTLIKNGVLRTSPESRSTLRRFGKLPECGATQNQILFSYHKRSVYLTRTLSPRPKRSEVERSHGDGQRANPCTKSRQPKGIRQPGRGRIREISRLRSRKPRQLRSKRQAALTQTRRTTYTATVQPFITPVLLKNASAA